MINLSLLKILSVLLLFAVLSGLSCGDDDDKVTNPDNNPPVIDSITAEPDTFVANSLTIVTVTAHDPDSDALTYSWIPRESWMTAVGGAGNIVQFSNCCPITELSTGYVVVEASDNQGGTVRDSIQIWVEPFGK